MKIGLINTIIRIFLALSIIIVIGGLTSAKELGSLNLMSVAQTTNLGNFTWVESNDDSIIRSKGGYSPYIDPGDNGGDPDGLASNQPQAPGLNCFRIGEDVGATAASLNSNQRAISILLNNAYPYYCPTVFFGLQNARTVPGTIDLISIDSHGATSSELTTCLNGIRAGQLINAGAIYTGALGICLQQGAAQNHIYYLTITIALSGTYPGQEGTIGFWKNWNSHNTYTATQITTWLKSINKESGWLGPTAISSMVTMMTLGRDVDSSMENRFLAQYLATFLNIKSGRLGFNIVHDVSQIDTGNYLNLGNPSSPLLADIIKAIESKYGQSPSIQQLQIIKNICDALNNLSI